MLERQVRWRRARRAQVLGMNVAHLLYRKIRDHGRKKSVTLEVCDTCPISKDSSKSISGPQLIGR